MGVPAIPLRGSTWGMLALRRSWEENWHERVPGQMHEGRLQELGKRGTAKYLHGAAAGKDTTRMWGEGCCKLVSEDSPPPAVTSAGSHPSDGSS